MSALPASSDSVVYVTTAAEAAALDAVTIERGTKPGDLMHRAGEAAASEIERAYGESLHGGVCVFTGPGNNGGDGWVVAGALAQRGIPVRAVEVEPLKSQEARAAHAQAKGVQSGESATSEVVIVDALLGTGSTGNPRGRIAQAIQAISAARANGAAVVSLDVPSGVDATTGAAEHAVDADLTVTFATVKRGQLRARQRCGKIIVVEIGLDAPSADMLLPTLVTPRQALSYVPPISVTAHKGARGGVEIIGGGRGMVGAAILAGRGALRSGAGSVRICVDDENVTAAHIAVPVALVTRWSDVIENAHKYLHDWPEAIAIGPGFGTDSVARQLLDRTLSTWPGPLVVDADALNLLAGRLDELAGALGSVLNGARRYRTVITPHPAEMKRLLANGISTAEVDEQRYDLASAVAERIGAVVLLKGVPTIIAHPEGAVRVSAAGTPALATGGSGDVLTGIIAALLAQGVEPFDAAAAGAWAHGHAAELATGDRDARGITLDDVVERLRDVWVESPTVLPPGVLAEVPRVW
jgi:hydroxyethylthiazole kinase-like uncharacterized protein yjeF